MTIVVACALISMQTNFVDLSIPQAVRDTLVSGFLSSPSPRITGRTGSDDA